MTKLVRFMIMDLVSMKSEIKPKNLISAGAIAILGYISMGASGITIGLLPLVTLLATYPFASGNNGLDHLYAALGITRKSVVAGRYMFALAVGVLVAIIFFVMGISAAAVMGDAISVSVFAIVLIVAFTLTSVVVAINLPILFKLGFRDAKSFTMLFPPLLMVGLLLAMRMVAGGSHYFMANLSYDLSGFDFSANFVPIVVIAVVWVVLMACSFMLSLKFYSKRDF